MPEPRRAENKPRLKAAMDKAEVGQKRLARAVKVPRAVIITAVYGRVNAETAGKICRTLSEMTKLSSPEKKAVFKELVNSPGQSEPLTKRVSTEDPMENLKDF